MAKEKEDSMEPNKESNKDIPAKIVPKKLNLDLDAIVKKAQSMFGKDKAGSQMLATGSNLARPDEDTDYVLWTKNNFWKEMTGTRGLKFGRFFEVAGRMNSGKSSLCQQFMVEAQNQGHAVILVDAEQKFHAERYDKHLGGSSKDLLIVDTNSIGDIIRSLSYYMTAIKEQSKDAKILIVIDSIGVLSNKTEAGDDKTDVMSKQPALQAREIGSLVRRLNSQINQYQNRDTGEHTIAVLCCNQVYANVGGIGTVEKGGSTLAYSMSLILNLNRKKTLTKIKAGRKISFGIVSRCAVKKNHLFSGTETTAEMDIVVSADGISLVDEVKSKEKDVAGWDDEDSDSE